ncbi:MAG: murein transglycosylase [Acetobacteraceae bacterium]|nr:murein transglycosylase [Acetobacteraceae bacterium]MSP29690.1 murein transglycosylase [Acetobacteraceae bacterium]
MIRAASRLLGLLLLVLLVLLAACQTSPPGPSQEAVGFGRLPGWSSDRLSEALPAFHLSCRRLSRFGPETNLGGMPDGTPVIAASTRVGSWGPACAAAAAVPDGNDAAARVFFERYLEPHAMSYGENGRALFTGYYEPEVAGARRRGGIYQTPIHRRPGNLVQTAAGPDPRGLRLRQRGRPGRPIAIPDRAGIVGGALGGRGLELAWLADPVDAFFLQIQGSGRVLLPDGSVMRVGFAGTNGRPYVAIGKVLMDRGEMERDQVSMQSIRAWLAAHPKDAAALMNANPSYVFFREVTDIPPEQGAAGALGVPLTPMRSLAVDRAFIGMAVPIYIATTDPVDQKPIQRLFLAQDTGGAIKGPVRGDIFFGWGKGAEERAGLMKGSGTAWVLLPRLQPL